jgi:hypothetical protein
MFQLRQRRALGGVNTSRWFDLVRTFQLELLYFAVQLSVSRQPFFVESVKTMPLLTHLSGSIFRGIVCGWQAAVMSLIRY